MKSIKYIAVVALLAASLTACDSSRNSATIGGSQDTTNAVAGSNAGGVQAGDSADTSNNGNKNRGQDSTSQGNANPTGHVENDTTNQNKYHRPK
ncbi:hypothetical protein HH214_11395 [Mucilaginibacter robiniae]|uniref:Lipoprotein n=1 Tax=Mucilaginibacter robiniae TaxID=2728022 RepID=A0A7L5E086_9SPHI|nr:hypothetical protein [Mucilaginibacter robiniae]QJD96431.1 hypothetical protein HH214_11395 [Mucilaginibacter robiniae]